MFFKRQRPPHVPAPDLFFVCHRRRFLFLSVAKNACTSIKHLIYEQDHGRTFDDEEQEAIHEFFGFEPAPGGPLARDDSAALGEFKDYLRFAVYRDPVERALSAWADKTRAGDTAHRYFVERGLIGLDLDSYTDALEGILAEPDPLQIDEHLRPQHLCHRPGDVHHLVPLKYLSEFMAEKFSLTMPRRRNVSATERPVPTPAQHDRLRVLYAADYALVPNYPPLGLA